MMLLDMITTQYLQYCSFAVKKTRQRLRVIDHMNKQIFKPINQPAQFVPGWTHRQTTRKICK